MPSLTLPKAPLTQLRGKPVAGTWRLRQTSQGSFLEVFRFGGSWSPVSPKVKLHQGEGQTLLLDGGEVFVRDSR
jgi:hypothetical protein